MALQVNLRHLERKTVSLEGNLSPQDLDLEDMDEMVHLAGPLRYELEVEKLDKAVLVQGSLEGDLDCECVRCLKRFRRPLLLSPWACHLPLEGDERVQSVDDCVDLTPHIREDIVLAFPQHPLCENDCAGLPAKKSGRRGDSAGPGQVPETSSAWAELNKLKFK